MENVKTQYVKPRLEVVEFGVRPLMAGTVDTQADTPTISLSSNAKGSAWSKAVSTGKSRSLWDDEDEDE